MKLLLSILLLVSFAFAETRLIQDKTTLTFEDFKKSFTFVIASKLFGINNFIEYTGESKENFETFLRNAMLDDSFKKSIYFLYFSKVEYNVKYGDKMNNNIVGPKLEEGLEALSEFTKRTSNPIGGHLGTQILMKFYMSAKGDTTAKKYLKDFALPLYENNYCIGGLMLGKLYMGEFGKPNYQLASEILTKTEASCLKEAPDFILSNVSHLKVKANYFKGIKK